jgi:hypothetical protein
MLILKWEQSLLTVLIETLHRYTIYDIHVKKNDDEDLIDKTFIYLKEC